MASGLFDAIELVPRRGRLEAPSVQCCAGASRVSVETSSDYLLVLRGTA